MKKYSKLIHMFLFIVLCFFIQTIAFSAINSIVKITGNVYARVDSDVRITNFGVYNVSSNALSEYEEYSKNSVSFGTKLSTSDSYVIYKIEVTNYADDAGVFSINGLPEELDYELIDYKLKDKLCDANNKCNFGIVSTFYIKIKWKNYDANNLSHNVVLNFDFRSVYSISYSDISSDSSYPVTIMDGEDLNVTFVNDISNKINIYVDGVEHERSSYFYNNKTGVLNYSDVSGDMVIEKGISTLIEGKLFCAALKNFANNTTDAIYSSIDTYITYIGFYEEEIPSGYTKEEFFELPYTAVSEDERTRVYHDDGKLYIYSIDDIYANNGSYSLLRGFSNLTELNILALDTSQVHTAQSFFQDLSSLKYLDLSNFDSSYMANLQSMFSGCTSLLELDLSKFSTANAKTLSTMFGSCQSLTSLDISNFVNVRITDISSMFVNCYGLKNIIFGDFDTTNVTIMTKLFYHCESLESIDISTFNTSNVTDMMRMFGHCYSLKKIYIGDGWDISNVTVSERMFGDSSSLPNFNTNITDISKAYVGYGGYLTKHSLSDVEFKLNTLGSEFCIRDECFYLFDNDGTTVKLLAKYNLYAGGERDEVNFTWTPYGDEATGLQDPTMVGFKNESGDIKSGTIAFTDSVYWVEDGITYPKYVYDSNSNVYKYLENYKTYLSESAVINASRLISYDELVELGYNDTDKMKYLPTWIYTSSYWTGSSVSDTELYCVSTNPAVNIRDYNYKNSYGIRPVIEISISEIKSIYNN